MNGSWLPSPVVLKMLSLQRMTAPDAYYDGLKVASLPLHEHDDWCICAAHVEARLVAGHLPDDPFTNQEEPVTQTITANTSPCRTCGVAVEWARKYPTSWATCSPEHYRPRVDLIRAEVLARLGITEAPDDPAVVAVLDGRSYFADRTSHAYMYGEHEHTASLLGTRPQGPGASQPWAHLDARDLRKRIAAARRDLANPPAPPRLAPCKSASMCSGCGVSKATGWADYGTKKAPMVLCEACGEALERSGGDSEGWRSRLLAQALRLDLGGRAPSITFRAYVFKTAADLGARPAPPSGSPTSTPTTWRGSAPVWSTTDPNSGTPEERERVERLKAARAAVDASRPARATPALVLPGGSR